MAMSSAPNFRQFDDQLLGVSCARNGHYILLTLLLSWNPSATNNIWILPFLLPTLLFRRTITIILYNLMGLAHNEWASSNKRLSTLFGYYNFSVNNCIYYVAHKIDSNKVFKRISLLYLHESVFERISAVESGWTKSSGSNNSDYNLNFSEPSFKDRSELTRRNSASFITSKSHIRKITMIHGHKKTLKDVLSYVATIQTRLELRCWFCIFGYFLGKIISELLCKKIVFWSFWLEDLLGMFEFPPGL